MGSLRLARELTGRFLECACPLALSVGAFSLVAAAPALKGEPRKAAEDCRTPKAGARPHALARTPGFFFRLWKWNRF